MIPIEIEFRWVIDIIKSEYIYICIQLIQVQNLIFAHSYFDELFLDHRTWWILQFSCFLSSKWQQQKKQIVLKVILYTKCSYPWNFIICNSILTSLVYYNHQFFWVSLQCNCAVMWFYLYNDSHFIFYFALLYFTLLLFYKKKVI